MSRKEMAWALALLAVSVYILFPTPDELFIYPTLGLAFSSLFGISLLSGQIISAALYRLIGVIVLIFALVIGGKPIYKKFKSRVSKI